MLNPFLTALNTPSLQYEYIAKTGFLDSHIHKMHLWLITYWSFNWNDRCPFHILPEAWKRYLFRGEPLCFGHYSTPPPAPRTVLDTVIILRQFSFFFKRKGGVWDLILRGEGWLIEDLQWVRILHLMQSNGFDSGKGHQGYFAERQIATVRLWSLLIRVRKWVN